MSDLDGGDESLMSDSDGGDGDDGAPGNGAEETPNKLGTETPVAARRGHMATCACHCAECCAAGHSTGPCVVLVAGLVDRLEGQADVVNLIWRLYLERWGWHTLDLDEGVKIVRFGPDGDVMAVAADKRVHLICAYTGCSMWTATAESRILCLGFKPTGDAIAAGGLDGTVGLYDRATGQVKSMLRGRADAVSGAVSSAVSSAVSCVAFKSNRPNVLVSCSWGGTLQRWNLSTSKCRTIAAKRAVFWSVCFLPPRGDVIAVGGNDCNGAMVRLYNPLTGELKASVSVDAGLLGVTCMSCSPKGDLIAAGCCNGKIHLVDPCTARVKRSLKGHLDSVTGVTWNNDGTQLASCSIDRQLKIWDPSTGQCRRDVENEYMVDSISWSTKANKLASTSRDLSLDIWDAECGEQQATPEEEADTEEEEEEVEEEAPRSSRGCQLC